MSTNKKNTTIHCFTFNDRSLNINGYSLYSCNGGHKTVFIETNSYPSKFEPIITHDCHICYHIIIPYNAKQRIFDYFDMTSYHNELDVFNSALKSFLSEF